MIGRDQCIELDGADPLAPLRSAFALEDADARGLIYLDGNSLGVLPKRTAARVADVIQREWGSGLIASWNTAGWITLAQRVADKIACVVGARSGELMVADSTSINLYKVLSAALAIAKRETPARRHIVSERSNFPSDLYIADTLAREQGFDLALTDAGDLRAEFDGRTAVVVLTHVNYRTGRMHDMEVLTRAAHDVGALVIWDLAHSAGAVPVDLHAHAVDFAVGCGYKYLNGGPGAPAFVWVHPRHLAEMDRLQWRQPLAGWLGHAAPFEFATEYRPAPGIARFTCGTPPILSLAALECGIDVLLESDEFGGIQAIRQKSVALTQLFIELVESRCGRHGLLLVSPRDARARGSQVCFSHATAAYPMVQALIAHGVVGDFRAPDILRFGFAPMYTRYVDVWDAVDRFRTLLDREEWRDARFHARPSVT
jgi:kynureninase